MQKEFNQFELKGFEVDYYVDGKYVGSKQIKEKDRDIFGYHGRIVLTAKETIEVKRSSGKVFKIKKGIKYVTELQAICGKMLK